MIDDLSVPLGRNRSRAAHSGLVLAVPRSIVTALCLGAIIVIGWAWQASSSFDAGPMATATIRPRSDTVGASPRIEIITPAVVVGAAGRAERSGQAAERAAERAAEGAARAAVAAAAPPPAAGTKTITIIDGSSGQRREISVSAEAGPAPAPEEEVVRPGRRRP